MIDPDDSKFSEFEKIAGAGHTLNKRKTGGNHLDNSLALELVDISIPIDVQPSVAPNAIHATSSSKEPDKE